MSLVAVPDQLDLTRHCLSRQVLVVCRHCPLGHCLWGLFGSYLCYPLPGSVRLLLVYCLCCPSCPPRHRHCQSSGLGR